MQNTDQSSRFQEVTNLLISMEHFDAKSSAYSSFIHFLSHHIGSSQDINQSEIFNSNIEWAFSKLFSLSDEKISDRLYMVIIDILLNLDYTKPGAINNNGTSEELLSLSFNRVYKRVSHRLNLIRFLSQYKYVLKGENGYGGRFKAYSKLTELLRKLYSMFGTYSVEDTHPSSTQQPTITNQQEELTEVTSIIKNSQTINSILIMGVISERFSTLRLDVFMKVKSNIHDYLQNPNQIVGGSSPNAHTGHVSVPGFVVLAIAFLSANYALKYSKEDDLLQNDNDPIAIDVLKTVIEKLFQVESSPFVWQCTLIFLARLQTFFKPQKALLLFSPAIIRKIQSLFTESETSTQIAYQLVSSIPIVNENEIENSSQIFTKQAQLSTLFSPMASAITNFEGDYVEKLIKFANDRKDEQSFNGMLGMLPSKNQTYKAGIILGVSLKMINNDDEYLRKCFYDYFRLMFEPSNESNNQIPSLILQSIPYCIHHGSINKRNIGIVCNSIISILCIKYLKNYPIQNDVFQFLPNALSSLTNFISNVFSTYVTHISKVCLIQELEIMCDFLNQKFKNSSNLSSNSGVDFNLAYCTTVSTLLRFILANKTPQTTKTIFVKFIQMFSSKIGHDVTLKTDENAKEIDIPIMHNSARFISSFIPSRLSAEFLNQSFRLMKEENDLSFAVVCAGCPGVDESMMKVLIEKVHASNNSELFASFYEGRVAISSSETLKRIYEYTKSSTSGWFKKAPPYEFYQCIIETVTAILENVSLQESDMVELMKILEISLPKNEETLFNVRKPAKRMIFAMSVNHDAKPKESFIDTLIGTPMYADSIPGLISKVTVDSTRIRDAIHAWALHTFEDPLVRKANPMLIESIFKYSTDPGTLNVIINNIIEYMGSPTTNSTATSEKDPINAIELAQAAAEIAEQRNIKYTEYSPDLILRCAEYCLSPGNELRTSTIRFLINLFALDQHDPSKEGDSSLSNYENQMSPNDISSVFMSIFTKVFNIIGEGICLQIFDKAVSSSPLTLYHVMIIRALLAVHSNAFVELRVQPLIKLCTFKASKMDPVVLSQVERSILFFAHDNTSAFTRFLCQIPMNDLTTLCVNRLMMKENLRNQFINEYAKILSITSHTYYLKNSNKKDEVIDLTNTKCGLYQLLGIISSADINMECIGRVLTCILIWLGLFYFNKMLRISSSSFSSELKTISSVFSNIVKTNNSSGWFFGFGSSSSSSSSSSMLANDQPIQFVIHDLDEFIQCLQIAADQILNTIDVAQFDAFIDTSIKAVSTGSDAAIISIGIVFIQLLQRFSFYNSELSKSFRLKISEVISKCFNCSNSQETAENKSEQTTNFAKGVIPTRILAYALNSIISLPMLNQLSAIYQSHILKNLLDSCLQIRDRSEYLAKSIFDITSWLIPNVAQSVISNEKQRIPEFATRFFNLSDIKYSPQSANSQPSQPKNELILTVGIIDVLTFMVKSGIEFMGKMGKTRLNFVNLMLLMVCGNQRADIQEKIADVLKMLTSSKNDNEMIYKIIQKSLDRSEVKALCGNLINICTTPEGVMANVHFFTERYLNTLLCVYHETKSYKDDVSPFHTRVFKIFVRVISFYGGIKEEDLTEYQKSIKSLSLNALNQM